MTIDLPVLLRDLNGSGCRCAWLPRDEGCVDIAANAGAVDRLPFADRFAADFDGLAFAQDRELTGAAVGTSATDRAVATTARDVGRADRLAPRIQAPLVAAGAASVETIRGHWCQPPAPDPEREPVRPTLWWAQPRPIAR